MVINGGSTQGTEAYFQSCPQAVLPVRRKYSSDQINTVLVYIYCKHTVEDML